MLEDNDWDLVAKYLSNECSDAERKEIEGNPVLMEQVRLFRIYLEELFPQHGRTTGWNVEAALRNVHTLGRIPLHAARNNRDDRGKHPAHYEHSSGQLSSFQRLRLTAFFRVAAVIVLLLGLTYLTLNLRTFFPQKQVHSSTIAISTGRGEQKQVLLADGSEVTLNSETTIRFSRDFGKRGREVELVGEAFFSVAHHATPFFVRTKNGVVEDLSTEFSVESWPGEKQTEVVVEKGKVILRHGMSPKGKKVVVAAGEMSRVVDGVVLPPAKADLQMKLAWLNGAMIFHNTPLREVIAELGRKYPFSFEVPDRSLLSRKLTASFKREPFDEILKAIVISLDMRYERKGDTIILSGSTKG